MNPELEKRIREVATTIGLNPDELLQRVLTEAGPNPGVYEIWSIAEDMAGGGSNPPEDPASYLAPPVGGNPDTETTPTPDTATTRNAAMPIAGHSRFVFPVAGIDPKSMQPHWGSARGGSDIVAPRGTPVRAVENGVVEQAGENSLGGNIVMIRGQSGNVSYYAHLDSAPTVKIGDTVQGGQIIGVVGDSGNAKGTQPHLHFGMGKSIKNGGGAEGGVGTDFDVVAAFRDSSDQGDDGITPMNVMSNQPGGGGTAIQSGRDAPFSNTVTPNTKLGRDRTYGDGSAFDKFSQSNYPSSEIKDANADYYFPFGDDRQLAVDNILKFAGINPRGMDPYTSFLRNRGLGASRIEAVRGVLGGDVTSGKVADETMNSLQSGRYGGGKDLFRQLAELSDKYRFGGAGAVTGTQAGFLDKLNDKDEAIRYALSLIGETMPTDIRAGFGRTLNQDYSDYYNQAPQYPGASFIKFLSSRY